MILPPDAWEAAEVLFEGPVVARQVAPHTGVAVRRAADQVVQL